jgi:autotransporter passenger strand-loop-strand repeat protein
VGPYSGRGGAEINPSSGGNAAGGATDGTGLTTSGGYGGGGFGGGGGGGSYADMSDDLAASNVTSSTGAVPAGNGLVLLSAALVPFGAEQPAILLTSGGVIVDEGTITYGLIESSGATLTVNAGDSVSGITVLSGGTAVIDSGGIASGTVVNSGGTEVVYAGGTATGTTLLAGGVIDVVPGVLDFTSGGTAVWDFSDDVLTVTEGGSIYTQVLTGDYTNDVFQLAADATGGTDITFCFYPGTRIATPGGEVAVELLRAADIVCTANGEKPVRWVGKSHVATRFADRLRSLPVRITAGALGVGLPARDLLLSPDHAVFIDGILAQAGALVNGVSIIRETGVPAHFTYHHVELATHELLLAEGVAAESFVDNVDRVHFHNWDARETPATPIEEMPYPRAKSVRQLPAVLRLRLAVARQA